MLPECQLQYEGRGNDYMKAPVEERFEIKDGKASWKNRSEQGRTGSHWRGVLCADQSRRQNSSGCSRVLCSKRRATNCRCCPRAKRASRSRAKSSVRQRRIDPVPHYWSWLHAAIDLARPQRRYGGECVDLVLGRAGSVSKRQYRSCRKRNKKPTTHGQNVSRTSLPTSRKAISSSATRVCSIRAILALLRESACSCAVIASCAWHPTPT